MNLSGNSKLALTLVPVVILLAALLLLVEEKLPPAERPNILLVVLDDFGYGDLAINTNSDSPTPNLDDFAKQGVRFTRHYSESSCVPSRVALLTGQYAARHGFHPSANGIDPETVTLPDLLAESGYTNYLLGKWHLGDSEKLARPEHQGFHHWLGFINQVFLAGPHSDGVYTPGRPRYNDPWLENEQGEMSRIEGHLNDILTKRAIDIMDSAGAPWFIYLSYYAPHTPVQPAPRFADQYADSDVGRYQALKAQLDDNLGKIFSQIRASGTWQDTMVIVVSDNGGTAAAYPGNAPFQGAKTGYREGGVRTPMIMSWPAQWEGGKTRDDIAMIFDIYPSIATGLGLASSGVLDGQSLFPRNHAGQRELRWYRHDESGDQYSMLTADGKWRLLVWEDAVRFLQHESEFSGTEYRQEKPAGLLARMSASMEDWRQDVTEVKNIAASDYGDWRHYLGKPISRTPLGGNYTVGIAVTTAGASVSEEPHQLLNQEGYMNLSIEDGHLNIMFDQQHAKVEFPVTPGKCKSVVITSNQNKKHGVYYWLETPSRLSVYIDGQLVWAESYKNFSKSTESPLNPLQVRIRGSSHMPVDSGVFISTRLVGEKEIASELHPELIGSCSQPV